MLMIYLQPVLPRMAERAATYLRCGLPWEAASNRCWITSSAFEPLLTRIDPKTVQAMVDSNRQEPAAAPGNGKPDRGDAEATPAGDAAQIATSTTFLKVDLRVARIIAAEPVEGRRQAPRLTLDVGELGTRRCSRGSRPPTSGDPRRPPHGGGRQPRPAQDALRRVRGHGAGRRSRRRAASISWNRTAAPGRACASLDSDQEAPLGGAARCCRGNVAYHAPYRQAAGVRNLTDYALLLIGAILVNNFVLVQFLGLCPFMGVSNKLETAMGMSMATTFVLTLASACSHLTYHYLLLPLGSLPARPSPSSWSLPWSCSSRKWSCASPARCCTGCSASTCP
jgi:tRNA-binding EMAP/Myf-like protein